MADDLMGLGKAIEAITKELGELVNPSHSPDLVVGRLSTTLIASRGEDLQVEHPV